MLDNLLFNIDLPTTSPSVGSLLVAEPFLKEDNFCHSVILMVDNQKDGGSMGVVLNLLTNYTLDELVPEVKRDVKVYCGGPLSNDRLYFIHTLGDIIPGGREIMPGLWLSGDFDVMVGYINAGYPVEGHLRLFLGYSGWSSGQLDAEIAAHTWAVVPKGALTPDRLLTGDNDAMWHQAVRVLGPKHRGWLFHPQHPYIN